MPAGPDEAGTSVPPDPTRRGMLFYKLLDGSLSITTAAFDYRSRFAYRGMAQTGDPRRTSPPSAIFLVTHQHRTRVQRGDLVARRTQECASRMCRTRIPSQRLHRVTPTCFRDTRVNLRRRRIRVSQQLLDREQILRRVERRGGEGGAQIMRRHTPPELRSPGNRRDGRPCGPFTCSDERRAPYSARDARIQDGRHDVHPCFA